MVAMALNVADEISIGAKFAILKVTLLIIAEGVITMLNRRHNWPKPSLHALSQMDQSLIDTLILAPLPI